MFSGVVEEMAALVAIDRDQDSIDFTFKCSFADHLRIGQSISHNGVCLTVVRLTDDAYAVTAMRETLIRSDLGLLKMGDRVSVGRSILMNGRLDGHIVQGHVDGTATYVGMEGADGSTYFAFEYPLDKAMAKRGYMTIDKGSIIVSDVSLTIYEPTDNSFKVAIIPYTRENTNFYNIEIGSVISIEFDILGRYMARLLHFDT